MLIDQIPIPNPTFPTVSTPYPVPLDNTNNSNTIFLTTLLSTTLLP